MPQKTPASNDSKSVCEQSHVGSNPTRCAKTKGNCKSSCLLFWHPLPKGRLHSSVFQCSGRQSRPCAKVFTCGENACTAHSRRRPEGPLEPATLSSIQNIDFTVSLSSEGPLWMSFVFSCLRGKRAHEPQIPNICIQTSYKGINSSLFEWTHSLLPGEG